MASFHYCTLNEPHAAHEWAGEAVLIGTVWDVPSFHCCGVKTDPRLERRRVLLNLGFRDTHDLCRQLDREATHWDDILQAQRRVDAGIRKGVDDATDQV